MSFLNQNLINGTMNNYPSKLLLMIKLISSTDTCYFQKLKLAKQKPTCQINQNDLIHSVKIAKNSRALEL